MPRFILLFSLIFSFAAYAQTPSFRADETGVYLRDYNTAELQKMFKDLGYDSYINLPDNEYPRVFVQNIPADFASFEDTSERNRVFMQMLIPLILKVNAEVLEERDMLDAISYHFELNKDVDDADMYFLDRLAQKYDAVSHFKDTRKYMQLLSILKPKIDAVPPSIILAVAAIRTNWGTSRIALKANNLFKQRIWYQDEGLEPLEDKQEGYRYQIFDSLEDSIREYVLKLNSNINYSTFRDARAVSRKRGSVLYGKRFDFGLLFDSNLQNYAGLVDYTLTYYKLHLLDDAHLEPPYQFEE
ncbi:MAG: glucosaminidase domain-containing protein [Alphaproteobacteria bacterium]|nr:glucosaminidase domain-containing protein [Alphaproteobacteria bacterium]